MCIRRFLSFIRNLSFCECYKFRFEVNEDVRNEYHYGAYEEKIRAGKMIQDEEFLTLTANLC